MKWKPHGYQKKALQFLLEHACAALFLDPGLGKTAITLAALSFLKEAGLLRRALIIAPLRVCLTVWPDEVRKWSDFTGLRVEVLHGPKKDAALAREADLYVINPEGLEWLTQATKTRSRRLINGAEVLGKVQVRLDLKRWRALGFDTLVIDELSKFKHITSARFKMLKLVHGTFARRWGLTGTPAPNGLEDLFGQALILDQGRTFGPYVTHYRRQYFVPIDKLGYVWKPQEGAEERIYERLKPLALRMAAADYLDMPQLIEHPIRVELPPVARQVYDTMEADLVAKIASHVAVAANAAVASGKLRQIASGGLYLTPEVLASGFKLVKAKREWVDLHTEKVDAIADLVEELQGAPVLIAYDFTHDLERLRAKFGRDVPTIGGGADARELSRLIAGWNAGTVNMIFVHPAAAAHGIDGLQHRGRHLIFHTLPWDLEHYDQLIGRLRRQGSKAERVFVYQLVAKNTIDEAVLSALRSKTRTQQALFDALKDDLRSRRKKA